MYGLKPARVALPSWYICYVPSYFRPALGACYHSTSGLIQVMTSRYSAYFSTVGGSLALTKYRQNAVSDGNANFIVIPHWRSVCLIRAEARAKFWEDLALNDLNALRSARYHRLYSCNRFNRHTHTPTPFADEEEENWWVGHRFFDLKELPEPLPVAVPVAIRRYRLPATVLAPTAGIGHYDPRKCDPGQW